MSSLDQSFNKSVLNIIDKFSYEFFVVQQDFSVKCVCVNYDTKQALPGCKKCLGTGNKIAIRRITGASQESSLPTTIRAGAEMVVARNFFIKSEYPMARDNVIVDGDDVFLVYELQRKNSFHGEHVYQKCTSVPKKKDTELFLKNFREITGYRLP